MRSLYFILTFATVVVLLWMAIAGMMVYQIGKDIGIWIYIDRWIKWRYGWL